MCCLLRCPTAHTNCVSDISGEKCIFLANSSSTGDSFLAWVKIAVFISHHTSCSASLYIQFLQMERMWGSGAFDVMKFIDCICIEVEFMAEIVREEKRARTFQKCQKDCQLQVLPLIGEETSSHRCNEIGTSRSSPPCELHQQTSLLGKEYVEIKYVEF